MATDAAITGRPQPFDRVADADRPTLDDVGTQAPAVDERRQGFLDRQRRQMRAGLAEAVAVTDDVTDAKALADEVVERDTASGEVPAVSERSRSRVSIDERQRVYRR